MFGIDDVTVILELSGSIIDIYDEKKAEKELAKKIDDLISKIDDVFMRELRAANNMLTDLIDSSSPVLDDSGLLSKTEDLFMKNIGLNPKMKTGNLNNTTIIALSYLGMFRIGLLKEYDTVILTKFILRMFETGENFVRTEIFPEFYNEFFKNKCLDIVYKHEVRKKNLAKSSDYAKASAVRIGQVGIGIGAFFASGIGSAFKIPPGVFARGATEAISSLGKSIPEAEYFISTETIDNECSREIDLFCANIAKIFLQELNTTPCGEQSDQS